MRWCLNRLQTIGTSWLLCGRAVPLVAPEAPTEAGQAENAHSLPAEAAGSSLTGRHCAPKCESPKQQNTMTLPLQFQLNWQLWNVIIQVFLSWKSQ